VTAIITKRGLQFIELRTKRSMSELLHVHSKTVSIVARGVRIQRRPDRLPEKLTGIWWRPYLTE
jgi:hypothetical protein